MITKGKLRKMQNSILKGVSAKDTEKGESGCLHSSPGLSTSWFWDLNQVTLFPWVLVLHLQNEWASLRDFVSFLL